MNNLLELIKLREETLEQILQALLSAPTFRFDRNLKSNLPTKPGLYAVSKLEAPCGEYLRAGLSERGKKGLRGRIWDQHYQTGGSRSSDLIEIVQRKKHANSPSEARLWIRENCQVQWIVEEDSTLLRWAEHRVLSAVQPIWGQ